MSNSWGNTPTPMPGTEHDPPPGNYMIPSLTVTASTSAPIGPPFQTPVDPPTGIALPSAIYNRWVNNNRWLHAVGARTHETFTGCIVSSASSMSAAEVTIWRGYFKYAGVMKLVHSIWGIVTGTLRMYVTDDNNTTAKKFYDSTSVPSSPYTFSTFSDATSITFTEGEVYQLRITLDGTGLGNPSVKIDMLAIETAQDYTYPTLVALTSGVPTAANLATISTAQNYLYQLASVPVGSGAKVNLTSPTGTVTFYNGGFFLRARDSSTKQVTLNITYKMDNGVTSNLYTYAAGSGTVIDTVTLTSDGTERSDAYQLTAASYTMNQFYRIAVETASTSSNAFVRRVAVGGFIALTAPPPTQSHADTVDGASDIARVGGSGATNNLTEIRSLIRGTTTAAALGLEDGKGFQMLCPDFALGSVSAGPYTYVFDDTDGVKREHFWRYLYYKTNGDVPGMLTVGTEEITLPSTNSATEAGYQWKAYDLEQSALIAYGQTYTLDALAGAFEAVE